MGKAQVDLTGRHVGSLTVIRRDGWDKNGFTTWLCQCECRKLVRVAEHNLRTGKATSCGCDRPSVAPLSPAAAEQINEARIAKGKRARGGRGVIWIEYKGQRRTLNEWAELTGINRSTIYCRLNQGWSVEKTLTTQKNVPPDLTGQRFGSLTVLEVARSSNKGKAWRCVCDCGNEVFSNTHNLEHGRIRSCGCLTIRKGTLTITHNGETHTLSQWAKLLGLSEQTLRRRLNSGWSVEKAFTTKTRNDKKKEAINGNT